LFTKVYVLDESEEKRIINKINQSLANVLS
ncbi:MAG: hypothetical protein QG670_2199, partial [Thermoproteota archaeon]|nr:hypothetical protein [Thermoproteota archaeon]